MIRAYGDNVLVRLAEPAESASPSGVIALPTRPTSVEAQRATALSVGPGIPIPQRLRASRRTVPTDQSPLVGVGWYEMSVRVGDEVLLSSPLAGDPIDPPAGYPPGTYRVVREAEILAVVV